jgi:hypothetical protein
LGGRLRAGAGWRGGSATGNFGSREFNFLIECAFAVEFHEIGLFRTVPITASALLGSPSFVVGNALGFDIAFSCNGVKHTPADKASSLLVSELAVVGGVSSNGGIRGLESLSWETGAFIVRSSTKGPITTTLPSALLDYRLLSALLASMRSTNCSSNAETASDRREVAILKFIVVLLR